MPETIKLADGTEREVPTADEISALNEKAGKVDELEKQVKPDWRKAREKMEKQEKLLKEKGVNIDENGDPITPPPTGEKIREEAASVYEEKEAEKVEGARKLMLDNLAGSDENKKKVIEEKFKLVSGGRKITDHSEMTRLMNDAYWLANKTSTGNPINPVHHAASGDPSGAPQRTAGTGNRERGAEIAEALGYRFKGDKNKLINGK